MRHRKIPVTVITGFLGAGKTTLVNHILKAARPLRIGVVVNEFGEVGIDGQLIVADEDAVVEINNGCVCCTVRSDLVLSIQTLLSRYGDKLDRLIVETSGLADPAPVLQTFLADPELRDRVELECVLAVVDACHAQDQLSDDIAREQVVFADRIVVNKTDIATPAQLAALQETISVLNPIAKIELTAHSNIDVSTLIGQRSFSLDNLLLIEPELLDEGAHDHEHDNAISSCAFVVPGEMNADRFNRWANQVVQAHGQTLLRMKAVINMRGEGRRLYFHSVHMLMDTCFGKTWEKSEERKTRFVVIGRDLNRDELYAGLRDCVDELISS